MSEQRYSKNPLIKGAEVIAHFQNKENPLSEDEIIAIITNRDVARRAVKEGKITKKERYRLIEQAKQNLANREAISELKGIKYLEMPDTSADANNINEVEAHLEKKLECVVEVYDGRACSICSYCYCLPLLLPLNG